MRPTRHAGVYLFFIIFGLSVLCLILVVEAVIMFYKFTRGMSVRALRVTGTGRVPELTLCKGRKYHLFLSRTPRLCLGAGPLVRCDL